MPRHLSLALGIVLIHSVSSYDYYMDRPRILWGKGRYCSTQWTPTSSWDRTINTYPTGSSFLNDATNNYRYKCNAQDVINEYRYSDCICRPGEYQRSFTWTTELGGLGGGGLTHAQFMLYASKPCTRNGFKMDAEWLDCRQCPPGKYSPGYTRSTSEGDAAEAEEELIEMGGVRRGVWGLPYSGSNAVNSDFTLKTVGNCFYDNADHNAYFGNGNRYDCSTMGYSYGYDNSIYPGMVHYCSMQDTLEYVDSSRKNKYDIGENRIEKQITSTGCTRHVQSVGNRMAESILYDTWKKSTKSAQREMPCMGCPPYTYQESWGQATCEFCPTGTFIVSDSDSDELNTNNYGLGVPIRSDTVPEVDIALETKRLNAVKNCAQCSGIEYNAGSDIDCLSWMTAADNSAGATGNLRFHPFRGRKWCTLKASVSKIALFTADCVECPPNSVSNRADGGGGDGLSCVPCPVGTLRAPGATQCACPAGRTEINGVCKLPCGAGYKKEANGDCTMCPSNTYADYITGGSDIECTPCPTDTQLSYDFWTNPGTALRDRDTWGECGEGPQVCGCCVPGKFRRETPQVHNPLSMRLAHAWHNVVWKLPRECDCDQTIAPESPATSNSGMCLHCPMSTMADTHHEEFTSLSKVAFNAARCGDPGSFDGRFVTNQQDMTRMKTTFNYCSRQLSINQPGGQYQILTSNFTDTDYNVNGGTYDLQGVVKMKDLHSLLEIGQSYNIDKDSNEGVPFDDRYTQVRSGSEYWSSHTNTNAEQWPSRNWFMYNPLIPAKRAFSCGFVEVVSPRTAKWGKVCVKTASFSWRSVSRLIGRQLAKRLSSSHDPTETDSIHEYPWNHDPVVTESLSPLRSMATDCRMLLTTNTFFGKYYTMRTQACHRFAEWEGEQKIYPPNAAAHPASDPQFNTWHSPIDSWNPRSDRRVVWTNMKCPVSQDLYFDAERSILASVTLTRYSASPLTMRRRSGEACYYHSAGDFRKEGCMFPTLLHDDDPHTAIPDQRADKYMVLIDGSGDNTNIEFVIDEFFAQMVANGNSIFDPLADGLSETFESEGVCTKDETYGTELGEEGTTCDEADGNTYLTTCIRGAGANAAEDALNFDKVISLHDTDPTISPPELQTQYTFHECVDCPPGTAQPAHNGAEGAAGEECPVCFDNAQCTNYGIPGTNVDFPNVEQTRCLQNVNDECRPNEQFSCSARGCETCEGGTYREQGKEARVEYAGGGCKSCDYDNFEFSYAGRSCSSCSNGRTNYGVTKNYETGVISQTLVLTERTDFQGLEGEEDERENGGYCDFCTRYARDDLSITLEGCGRDVAQEIIPLANDPQWTNEFFCSTPITAIDGVIASDEEEISRAPTVGLQVKLGETYEDSALGRYAPGCQMCGAGKFTQGLIHFHARYNTEEFTNAAGVKVHDCRACPTGMVNNAEGQTTCTLCPSGMLANSDRTECNEQCQEVGQMQDPASPLECIRCGSARAPDMFVPVDGSGNAIRGQCASCPGGTYQPLVTDVSPIPFFCVAWSIDPRPRGQ